MERIMWVLNKAGVKTDTVEARKPAYHEETIELPGERDNASNNVRCTQARKTTHGVDWTNNIKTRTGLPVEESVRMTEDRDKWRKYVHGVANRRIEDG